MIVFYATIGLVVIICTLVHYSIKLSRYDKGFYGVLAGISACSIILWIAVLLRLGVCNG